MKKRRKHGTRNEHQTGETDPLEAGSDSDRDRRRTEQLRIVGRR